MEKLEEYLQVEEVRYEEHLILMAENCDLRYGEDTTLHLTLRIPASWDEEDVTLYFDGDILTTLTADELTSKGKVELGEVPYIDFQAEVTVSDQGDGDAFFSKTLKAVKGDQESNEVVLYREVEMPPETIETAGRILDEIGTIALSYSGSEKQNGGTQETGKVGGSEEVLEEVYAYLKNSPEIGKVQRNGSRIDFITKDGFSSFFAIEDPDLNLAGSGDNHTTDPSELQKKFKHDTNFREAVIDPDVMVLCPLYTSDFLRSGKPHISSGEKLAKYLGGEEKAVKDESCMDFGVFKEMSQYGTVMLCTHGGYDQRQDGSNIVHFRLYNRKVEKETAELKLDGLIKTSDAIWEGIEYFDFPNGWGAQHLFRSDGNTQQASFGLRFLEKKEATFPMAEEPFWIFEEINYEIDIYTDAIMHTCYTQE